MSIETLQRCIETADVAGVRAALAAEPALAQGTIRWYLNRWNESEPLHYVSDCVGNGHISSACAGEIAQLLLAAGAAPNGTAARESPLLAAASLGADAVAKVLLEAGADLERTGVFGARALHWAAWTGAEATTRLLLARRPQIEARCAEFGATPLFWAVHGYGPNGARAKQGQVGAARALLEAGARVDTSNKHGTSAREMARQAARPDMTELLERHAPPGVSSGSDPSP